MSTSGTYTFSVTAAQVIQAALEDLGIVGAGGSVSTNDSTLALNRLNLIAKQWQGDADMAQGLKVWNRQRVYLFLALAQSQYSIGPASTDDRATTSYVATTLRSAKSASATTISLTSTTGMTAADNIGFVLSSGALGWGTISTVDSSTQVTITANSLGAASSGAVVFTYTSKAQRFPVLETVDLRDSSDPTQPIDMGLDIYRTVEEYEILTQKSAQGDPTVVLFEPGRIASVITLDYAAANVYKLLRMSVLYPAENYDSSANDIAFPQEFFAALEWELAKRLAPAYGVPFTAEMASNYQTALAIARELNPQRSSVYFEPGKE